MFSFDVNSNTGRLRKLIMTGFLVFLGAGETGEGPAQLTMGAMVQSEKEQRVASFVA